jgi:uncharacterized repeat protein (TIGR03833 family)
MQSPLRHHLKIKVVILRGYDLSVLAGCRFVTSTTAPIATGRSESCRVLHPRPLPLPLSFHRMMRYSDDIMNGQNRNEIHPGTPVEIILKADQRTGKRTSGIVKDILTSAAFHSRGIKVRLESGLIGRVQEILPNTTASSHPRNIRSSNN